MTDTKTIAGLRDALEDLEKQEDNASKQEDNARKKRETLHLRAEAVRSALRELGGSDSE